MKKSLGICFLFVSVSLFGQNKPSSFGIITNYNFATTLDKNPQRPQDGTEQQQSRSGIGIGIYHRLELNKRFDLESSLSYQTKGFNTNQQFAYLGTDEYDNINFDNIYRYLDLNSNIQFKILKNRKFIPKVYAGLGVGYLLSYKLNIDVLPFNTDYPISEYVSNKPNLFSFFYTAGVQIDVNNKFTLGFELKNEIGNFINSGTMKAKHWIWSFKMCYNLSDILG